MAHVVVEWPTEEEATYLLGFNILLSHSSQNLWKRGSIVLSWFCDLKSGQIILNTRTFTLHTHINILIKMSLEINMMWTKISCKVPGQSEGRSCCLHCVFNDSKKYWWSYRETVIWWKPFSNYVVLTKNRLNC